MGLCNPFVLPIPDGPLPRPPRPHLPANNERSATTKAPAAALRWLQVPHWPRKGTKPAGSRDVVVTTIRLGTGVACLVRELRAGFRRRASPAVCCEHCYVQAQTSRVAVFFGLQPLVTSFTLTDDSVIGTDTN